MERNRMERDCLRTGYTTGTCAAAAAKAAAVFLLTKEAPGDIHIGMPDGGSSVWHPVRADEIGGTIDFPADCWGVKKDSGDDPDVTNGVWVYARVSAVSDSCFADLCRNGAGYGMDAYPRLYLTGGAGIGMVTKPGLSCPPDHYAINPVPREMILASVDEVCRAAGYDDCLLIEILIPEGVRLAEKTFNPRLGIEGGISILGTTGIVRPMSEDAMRETIRLDIRMKVLKGQETIIMTPGNYGERFLKETLHVALGEAVVCSNFVADAVRMLREAGVRKVLFVGHMGKLIKVAAGVPNTHSRYGDLRMETMERMLSRVLDKKGVAAEDRQTLCQKIREANTTEDAASALKEQHLAEDVFAETACAVKEWLEIWSGHRLQAETVVFSSAHGIIGMTEEAGKFLEPFLQGTEEKTEGLG